MRVIRIIMKRLFTLIAVCGFGLASFSQVEIHENGQPLTSDFMTIDSAISADHTISYFYLVNNGSSSISIDWDRIRRAHAAPFYDQVCDELYCYEATNTTVFSNPTSKTIAAGDSMLFQPKVYADGTAGCVIYSYLIYSDHGAVVEDSVQIKFRFGGSDCFLDTPEDSPITYSVYPNPASTHVTIQAKTNGNAVQVRIYNIMGELVQKTAIVDGQNVLSVEDLTNGVYFYSIVKNNEVIETKKLIVRH